MLNRKSISFIKSYKSVIESNLVFEKLSTDSQRISAHTDKLKQKVCVNRLCDKAAKIVLELPDGSCIQRPDEEVCTIRYLRWGLADRRPSAFKDIRRRVKLGVHFIGDVAEIRPHP
jgi:hypothetical protein